MTESTPIIVNSSTASAVGGTVVRDVLVIVAAIPIVVKLIGARDLTGLLQWLQSSDGATALAIVLPMLATGWRAWRANRSKEQKVLLAQVAPDAVAVVK